MDKGVWIAAIVGLIGLPALAQGRVEQGREAFEQYCAVCHGMNAEGEGPLSPWLIRNPSDLTALTAQNDGTFPTDYVYFVIDGRGEVAAHGPREMPVWGTRFGLTDPDASADDTQERILNIIAYLETIQD